MGAAAAATTGAAADDPLLRGASGTRGAKGTRGALFGFGGSSLDGAKSYSGSSGSVVGGSVETVMTCPHLHFTRRPASSGFHEYVFPHAEHPNRPRATSDMFAPHASKN
jgi:hypothetical protein